VRLRLICLRKNNCFKKERYFFCCSSNERIFTSSSIVFWSVGTVIGGAPPPVPSLCIPDRRTSERINSGKSSARSIPSIRISGTACPKISCCLDGKRGNPQHSLHRTLDYIKVRYTVIMHYACPAEPETPFPAHLIIPELILHAYVIEPDPGNKGHDKDKHSCKGNTRDKPIKL